MPRAGSALVNLSAFISLKQSADELLLPRYGDFRDALIAGDADALRTILEEADEETSGRYAQQLLRLFRQEATQGYVDAARSIVERAIAEPKLRVHQTIIDAVLGEAVRNPSVRPQLRLANPGPILSEGRRLPEDEFVLLVGAFADFAALEAEGVERLAQVSEALTAIFDDIPPEARGGIRDSLTQVSGSFGAYLPLVEADPTLLPDEAGPRALELFTATLDVKSPAFEVLRLWFATGPSVENQDRFVGLVAQRIADLGAAGTGSEEDQRAVVEMVDVASALPSVSDGAAREVATTLHQRVQTGTLRPELMPAALDLAGVAVARLSDGGELVAPLVTAFASQDPEGLIGYATSRGGIWPRTSRARSFRN
jgi:hypothetical protein